jgi:predicted dehydrogenase
MRVLIYGFGRMGLTHFSILNSLNPEIKFSVIEPNKILRTILKKNINAKFYSDDSNLDEPFDFTLITTPPSIHLQLMKKSLKRGDKKIFVEKPFGGFSNTNLESTLDLSSVFIGYVLRFNSCIQWIKSNIDPNEIKSIHGQYLSNTIEKKPKGWRNGKFSGVCNEMGSHVIDLIQYITNENELDLISSEFKSVISDIDDIVEANLKTKNKIDVSLYFNWVNKKVRKPVFGIDIEMKDGHKYSIDQQQINKYKSDEFITKVSVTDLAKTVPYYLRGVDFTDQMIDLINDNKIMSTAKQALSVNNTIAKILNK